MADANKANNFDEFDLSPFYFPSKPDLEAYYPSPMTVPLWERLAAANWDPNEIAAVKLHLIRTYETDLETNYADNLRLARVANLEEVAGYKERYDRGCCGFYDEVEIVVRTDGTNGHILIGYNYGH